MPFKPVDTAIEMVVGPLIDDTDFKAEETSIAYNATNMDVDFVVEKSDGTTAKTDITLTSGGTSDWTHISHGFYRVEITAAQNAEEGNGYIIGKCDGVLTFRSPTYTIVPTKVYNSLVNGSDNLEVDTIQWLGTACATPTTNGVPEVDLTHIAGAAVSASTAQLGVNLVNIAGSAVSTSTAQLGVNAVNVGGTSQTGRDLGATLGAAGAGLTAVPYNPAWDAEIQSEVQDAIEANNLDHVAGTATAIPAIPAGTWIDMIMDDGTATYDRTTDSLQAIRDASATVADIADGVCDEALSGHTTSGTVGQTLSDILTDTGTTLDGKIDAVDNYVDTEVAAIKGVTDKLDTAMELDGAVYRFTTNSLEQGPTGSGASAESIADAVWDELSTGHTDAGKAGAKVWTDVPAILEDTGTTLPATLGTPAGASVSADVAAVKVDTAAILVDTGTTLDGRIPAALVSGRMDCSVGAMASNVVTAAALNADAGTEIATAVGALAVEGSVTLKQSLQLSNAAAAGKVDGAGTTTVHLRDLGDSKNRVTATVDEDGNRSAVTPSYD